MLGDMKHETTKITGAEIYGPKFYRIFEKDKIMSKAKGVSLKMKFEKDSKINNEISEKITN